MRWEQLQNAVANNIEIGIHSHSHANLGKINYLAAIEEITASIQCYKKNMNKEPLFMSYPFGKKADITEAVKDYIKEHTKLIALFSADGNINFSPINKYEIRRINIGTGDIGISFPFKINGGFSFLGDKK